MSGRLVGETVEWLRTPAAQDLTVAERLILVIIAERCHEHTRRMLRHNADDVPLIDRLSEATGLDHTGGLRRAFQRLARRGLEVRVPVSYGRDRRPVYAHEGRAMGFQLPRYPASVRLPDRPRRRDDSPPSQLSLPVDNHDRPPVDNPDGESGEGGRSVPPLPPEGGLCVLRGWTHSPPLIPLSTSKDRSLFALRLLTAEEEVRPAAANCGQPACGQHGARPA